MPGERNTEAKSMLRSSSVVRPSSPGTPIRSCEVPQRRSAHTRIVRRPDWASATARFAATMLFFSQAGLVTSSVLAPCAAAMEITRVRRLR